VLSRLQMVRISEDAEQEPSLLLSVSVFAGASVSHRVKLHSIMGQRYLKVQETEAIDALCAAPLISTGPDAGPKVTLHRRLAHLA
jgi:hypothetical protein